MGKSTQLLSSWNRSLKLLVKNSWLLQQKQNKYHFDLFHLPCQMSVCEGGENMGRAKSRISIICRELIRTINGMSWQLSAWNVLCYSKTIFNCRSACQALAGWYYLALFTGRYVLCSIKRFSFWGFETLIL